MNNRIFTLELFIDQGLVPENSAASCILNDTQAPYKGILCEGFYCHDCAFCNEFNQSILEILKK